MNKADLIKIGGREWRDRVYFNADVTAPLIGLELTFYKTGNINSARLNGERISNTAARKILTQLEFGKIWWQPDAGFQFRDIDAELAGRVLEAIEEALS